MGLAQAITEARTRRAQEQARALEEHFRAHGTPEKNDLGRILMVKRQFPLVDDSTFARVLNEAQDPILLSLRSRVGLSDAEIVKALISKP